ncbi:MAG: type II secretion system protein [Opitutales bacterium]|nr:type II secretion system protein [Opitutales bacterium]MBQ7332337.1 type II secretion system protein [Opitutales bacterium]MBQ8723437.1 type II secretion system protein [Opitutales bacterium]MBQ9759625.1 type II secretion system protein [Opitutales bacterium]
MKNLKKLRKGFTLIELLVVIAIIGILAGLASQAIPAAFNTVYRMRATNNLRSIAQSYINYSQSGAKARNISNKGSNPEKGQASSVADYAEVLARYAGLTSGKVWYVDSDPNLQGEPPATVLSETTSGTNQLKDLSPISWAVVANAQKNPKNQSGYPIAWLRGLSSDGTWDENAPFGANAGIIAFADGSVVQVNNLQLDEVLMRADGKGTTANYQEAITSGSAGGNLVPTVLEDKP